MSFRNRTCKFEPCEFNILKQKLITFEDKNRLKNTFSEQFGAIYTDFQDILIKTFFLFTFYFYIFADGIFDMNTMAFLYPDLFLNFILQNQLRVAISFEALYIINTLLPSRVRLEITETFTLYKHRLLL
jgi:hypothetical protein